MRGARGRHWRCCVRRTAGASGSAEYDLDSKRQVPHGVGQALSGRRARASRQHKPYSIRLLRADITKHSRLPPVALDRLQDPNIERLCERAVGWQRDGILLRLECRIDQLDRGCELRVDDPGEQRLVVDEGVESMRA